MWSYKRDSWGQTFIKVVCACRSPVGSRAGEDTSGEEQRVGEQFEAAPEYN
jgi:hypothetical protein